jgi:lipopolysaccharide transport system permease protein
MINYWRRLIGARDLLYTWTAREFKARYRGSTLGVAWAILYPLAFLLVLLVVFAWFLRVPTAGIPAAVFLYCGLAPWLLTSGTIQNSAFALIANLELVKNAAFPREILPLATVLVGSIDFAFSALLLAVLILVYRLPVGVTLVFVPVLFAVQAILTLALCLFCAAWIVFYRDVRFLVPVVLQFWMYLTPVFYPIEMVPERARSVYLLNPMAALVDSYRRVILFRQWPEWWPFLIATGVSSVALAAAYAYFKQAEWEFADRI